MIVWTQNRTSPYANVLLSSSCDKANGRPRCSVEMNLGVLSHYDGSSLFSVLKTMAKGNFREKNDLVYTLYSAMKGSQRRTCSRGHEAVLLGGALSRAGSV